MADFISALTGTQMDAALLDMAEHNSEAYAVGERNGIAVASDDVTYHNNARYYAQIASSQIVGDASSAVRWDTDQSEVLTDAQKAQARENINAASDSDVVKITAQTLTTAQQAQARANIMAGGTNPNLLDNPWFTIDQTGVTSGAAVTAADTRDRWRMARCSYTFNNDGSVTTAFDGSTGVLGAYLIQYAMLDEAEFYEGKPVTVSAYVDGILQQAHFNLPTAGAGMLSYTLGPDVTVRCANQTQTNRGYEFQFVHSKTSGLTIGPAKVEEGDFSTLPNDGPPDHQKELAKCQRVFWRLNGKGNYSAYGLAVAPTTTSANLFVTTPVPMRATPTVTYNGTFQLRAYDSAGDTRGITAISVDTIASNVIKLHIASVSLTVGLIMQLRNAGEAGYIDFSCRPS